MNSFFQVKSLKFKIFLLFSIISVVTLLVFGYFGYTFFSDILIREILTYTSKIIDEAATSIDSYFGQIATVMQIIAQNDEIVHALKNPDMINPQKLYSNRKIKTLLENVINLNPKVKDFIIINSEGFVYDFSGEYIVRDYNFYQQNWFPMYQGQKLKAKFIGIHPQNYYWDQSLILEDTVSAIIPILDIGFDHKKKLGMILCNLNVTKIQELTKQTILEKSGFILIMDENNRIIYYPPHYEMSTDFKTKLLPYLAKESGNFIINEKSSDMVVVYKTSAITDWKIIAFIPKNEILDHLYKINLFTIILIVLCIILVIIASITLSNHITKPLDRLMKRMPNIEHGDLDIKLYDDSTEEIKVLSSRIDLMVERIHTLNRNIYTYKLTAKEAELKVLQSQINPHFLYNTLQSIKAMAFYNRGSDISRMITALGNMLHYAVYNAEELVPIEFELNHVENYLQIQRYRYPENFDYTIQYDKDILQDFKTLKLILQPITENSIIHGLKENQKNLIDIRIRKIAHGIEFKILDNGKGIPPHPLQQITKILNGCEEKGFNDSIGLKNVHDRIRLKFGDAYGLTINSTENTGTDVTILLPTINIKGEILNENGCC